MQLKKSIREMTDEEYFDYMFKPSEKKEVTPEEELYKWIERLLARYGNCFVSDETFDKLDIKKLKKDLQVKGTETTEVPATLMYEVPGKIIWLKK